MATYTVIGCTEDDGEGAFAEVVEAESAFEAEAQIDPDARVVLVLAGAHELDPSGGDFAEGTVWTIAAFYPDNDQRYASEAHGTCALEAREAARDGAIEETSYDPAIVPDGYPIVIVGAVVGSHESVDVYAGNEGWALPPAQRSDWCTFED